MSNLSWISSQMTTGMTINDIAHENVSKICTELHLGIANNITKGSFQLLLHQGDFPFFSCQQWIQMIFVLLPNRI
jgi:hypothetical protein